MTTTTKRITRATIKSFVEKNSNALYIRNNSDFDGNADCVMETRDKSFRKTSMHDEWADKNHEYTLGIRGAWLVGQSRDYFNAYEDEEFKGFDVYNSCGHFVIAIKK